MNPAHGTWIKNQDVLPECTKKSIQKIESVEKNTAADLVKNQDDDNNENFTFIPISDKGSQFKTTNQFDWISNMPKFSELIVRESYENIDYTECFNAPIVEILDIL